MLTSQHGRKPTNDECYTPQWVFDALGITFDLDVCAPIGGTGIVPADRHYSIEDDGLAQPWAGRVWLNPPYSNATPWVDKFVNHANGLALVITSKSKWFHNLYLNTDAMMLMPTNLKFLKDGKNYGIQFQTAMFAMGDGSVQALHRSQISRVRV